MGGDPTSAAMRRPIARRNAALRGPDLSRYGLWSRAVRDGRVAAGRVGRPGGACRVGPDGAACFESVAPRLMSMKEVCGVKRSLFLGCDPDWPRDKTDRVVAAMTSLCTHPKPRVSAGRNSFHLWPSTWNLVGYHMSLIPPNRSFETTYGRP